MLTLRFYWSNEQMTQPQTTPAEKETFHREAASRITTIKYTTPGKSQKPKNVTLIKRKGMLKVYVQTIRDGGGNNLHYHTNSETMWMLLRGRGNA